MNEDFLYLHLYLSYYLFSIFKRLIFGFRVEFIGYGEKHVAGERHVDDLCPSGSRIVDGGVALLIEQIISLNLESPVGVELILKGRPEDTLIEIHCLIGRPLVYPVFHIGVE